MKNLAFVFFLILASTIYASPSAPVATPYCLSLNKLPRQGAAGVKLKQFLEGQWKHTMTEFPEWATYTGFPGQNDRWTDASPEAIARRKQEAFCDRAALAEIQAKDLKGEDLINYDLAKRNNALAIEGHRFPSDYLVLDHMSGLQIDLPDMLEAMPTANKKDYENMIARLEQVPRVATQIEALMREGLKKHVTPIKMFMKRVPAQFDKILTAKVEDSPLYKPFVEIRPPALSQEDKSALQTRAKEAIANKVFPALRTLKTFVVNEYIPGAREKIAASDLPDGKAWYAFMVKQHTTTDLTPDQLHELGLKEVARITQEMEKVRDQVKFKGDLKAFNKFLLSDKQFFYTDKTDLLVGFRDIAKRIDPELSKEFKTLPRLTYGVREMPAYKAPEAPAAYYMGGSLEAGRPGYFEANTYDLKARPKWGMEALTLHEAVPGHHLQIALAQELEGVPDFRKFGGYTAFVEGWGLYAESLGADLGLYKDPYSKYGQLSYEMWRAIRLVVDTGMHAKGWTRDQAITYFQNAMPKAQPEIEVEVDRYITWPGQALAYKVGQLKFRELRGKAQAALGDKFDVREFHDQLLRHGALPMDVLEKSVMDWMDHEKNGKKTKPDLKNKEKV